MARARCFASPRTRSARSGTATAWGLQRPLRRSAWMRRTRSPSSMPGCPACWKTAAASGIRLARTAVWPRGWKAGSPPCPTMQGDLCTLLDEMRLFKDGHEQDLMRRASRISAQAHIRAMQRSARMLRSGQALREYHLEAELLHALRDAGVQSTAYTCIVAAGANACVLHYRADAAPVRNGDLVLIDAGGELDGYASDHKRTFPANGRFTG